MADIKYNLNQLEVSKGEILDLAENIDETKGELAELLNELKVDWQTKSGNKFFEIYGDEWAKGIEAFATRLRKLSEMLDKTTLEYASIKEEIDKIKCEQK